MNNNTIYYHKLYNNKKLFIIKHDILLKKLK